MESKIITVKENKVEDKIDFYTAFGYELINKEEQEDGKVALTFERDKEHLSRSYGKVKKGERTYRSIARPYPLGAAIAFVIACIFLALYFILQKIFMFYIIFLYLSLTFYGFTLYLLIIFLVILVKRHGLLKRVIHNVSLEAGTSRELPLERNIKEETDDSWFIAENI